MQIILYISGQSTMGIPKGGHLLLPQYGEKNQLMNNEKLREIFSFLLKIRCWQLHES